MNVYSVMLTYINVFSCFSVTVLDPRVSPPNHRKMTPILGFTPNDPKKLGIFWDLLGLDWDDPKPTPKNPKKSQEFWDDPKNLGQSARVPLQDNQIKAGMICIASDPQLFHLDNLDNIWILDLKVFASVECIKD